MASRWISLQLETSSDTFVDGLVRGTPQIVHLCTNGSRLESVSDGYVCWHVSKPFRVAYMP